VLLIGARGMMKITREMSMKKAIKTSTEMTRLTLPGNVKFIHSKKKSYQHTFADFLPKTFEYKRKISFNNKSATKTKDYKSLRGNFMTLPFFCVPCFRIFSYFFS
jgi:hypothetical protein